MDRSRLLELRSEATAELAGARAKEERLRALETARAEAEARAAAHAADAEVCRLQVRGGERKGGRGGHELSAARRGCVCARVEGVRYTAAGAPPGHGQTRPEAQL